MEEDKIIAALHPLERKVLPILARHSHFEDIIRESKLKDVEVMRALQWLQNRNILKLSEDAKEVVELDSNGRLYLKEGLPEGRFLKVIAKHEGLGLEDIKERAGLSDEEIGISIGTLRAKVAIEIDQDKRFKITDNGRKLLEKTSLEEGFLRSDFPLDVAKLSPEQRFGFEALKKRKSIVRLSQTKKVWAELTELGKKLSKLKISGADVADSLTSKMIMEGSWKGKQFRAYDVSINVPKVYGGKRHFVRQSIDYAKRIWTDLGFREMEGPLLNQSFWNFDALFTAQDHPVREMQDTFFIKTPKTGRLPDKRLVEAVREAHENGVSGSRGWRYKWNPDEAKKNVMRTHTTVLSARTIAALKQAELPAKFFAVGRCFRNEAVDWSHLFEFNQTEGIVVDPDANFRHLLGYLKVFLGKMGYEKARFRPAHFPYTEPSVEMDIYHPIHKKWMELGGAGVFRPEVVVPLLGKDIPVLAWGPGFDRIMMEYYNLSDLRDLYRNDLKQMRDMKSWMRK
jgi:phenylalanyl-tRNA synthetase alpha chain